MGKELTLTRWFVRWPFAICAAGLAVILLCTALMVTQGLMEVQQSTDRDFVVWGDVKVTQWDKQTKAEMVLKAGGGEQQYPYRRSEAGESDLFVIFSCKGCENVWTPEALREISDLTGLVTSQDEWGRTCFASGSTIDAKEEETMGCALESVQTPLLMFYGADLDALEQDDVTARVKEVYNTPELWRQFQAFFDKNFDPEQGTGSKTRLIFKAGLPLAGYLSQVDHALDQEQKIAAFHEKLEKKIAKRDQSEWEQIVFSLALRDVVFDKIVNKDLQFAFFSVLFVVFFICVHTRSLFIGSMSMLLILASFPISLVLANFVFQSTYYSSVHNLAVFIVLGIAADDIFVVFDAWTQSENIEELYGTTNDETRIKRMSYTFRRAWPAILVTSSTTSIAFLANLSSEIMPIQSFGVYAAVLVPVNYILFVFYFPAVLIIWDKYLKNLCTREKGFTKYKICKRYPETRILGVKYAQEEKQETKTEKFFGGKFNDVIFRAKWVILFFVFAWSAASIYYTSQMGPMTKDIQFLPDDHWVQKAKVSLQFDYYSGQQDLAIDIAFFWGVKDLDISANGMWDPNALGKLTWDETFDPTLTTSQEFVIEFCQDLLSEARSSVVKDQRVDCWMMNFKNWIEEDTKTRGDWPVAQEDFYTRLNEYILTEQGQSEANNFEIGLDENGVMKYMYIGATAVGNPSAVYDEKMKVWNAFKDITQEWNDKAEAQNLGGIDNIQFNGGFFLAIAESDRAFLRGAISGIAIAISFSFVVLLIATTNIIQALTSVMSVFFIVTSVLAIMVFQDWELGVAESMGVVISIGFSVDYVVHLSSHYIHSPHPRRFERMQESLREMGGTILGGSITTIGSGVFLFPTTMIFFNKFAILITATISLSFFYSMVFFAAQSHAYGPNGKTGDVVEPFKRCLKKKQ